MLADPIDLLEEFFVFEDAGERLAFTTSETSEKIGERAGLARRAQAAKRERATGRQPATGDRQSANG